MNNQQAFDTVARHIFNQGERAYVERDGCLYRAPNGLKCAVGCLIPDEEYHPGLESSSLPYIWKEVSTLRDLDFVLLRQLQNAHDNSFNWSSSETMRAALNKASCGFGLDADVLNSLRFAWEKDQ